jgi:hypothetical protein
MEESKRQYTQSANESISICKYYEMNIWITDKETENTTNKISVAYILLF